MKRWMMAAAVLLVGCGGRYGELPQREQARFERCRETVRRAQCDEGLGDGDPMYRNICIGNLASRYSDQPTEPERERWLVQNGCPATMVGVEDPVARAAQPAAVTTASSGGAAP